MKQDKVYFKRKDIAERLDVSVDTVDKLIKSRKLKAVRILTVVRIHKDDLARFEATIRRYKCN